MKAIVCAVLLAAVSLTASATDVKTHVGHSHSSAVNRGISVWGNPPAEAAKLIFYGGDNNESSEYDDGFANGNTLLVPDTSVYAAVTVPEGSKVVATGVLFVQFASQVGDIFDPNTATYDIRTGVSQGNGGTEVGSGSGRQSVSISYGLFGLIYSTSVAFTKPITPTGGLTYFVNESPQCTDTGNSLCSELQYFAINTTEQTNGINADLQPSYESFFNSAYFGYTWGNLCDLLGGQSPACQWQSWGLYGTK